MRQFGLCILLCFVLPFSDLCAQKQLIKTVTTYSLTWGLAKESVIEFDQKGQQISFSRFQRDTLLWREEISYDSLGRKSKETTYASDGHLQRFAITEYDSTGQFGLTRRFNADSSFYSFDSCWFDRTNNMIESRSYFADGTPYLRLVQEFDRKGNMVRRSVYDLPDKLRIVENFKYNRQGDLWKSETRRSDKVDRESFSYAYDGYGNWVTQLNEIKSPVAFRIIVYY